MRSLRQLATWVRPAVHEDVTQLALRRSISVSALLGELLDEAVGATPPDRTASVRSREARPDRVTIRLRPGDATVVGRIARVRRMKPSTYIAALVRAHLVEDPPLPPRELAVMERLLEQLSAVGRNLNQITRAVNAGTPVSPSTAALIERAMTLVEAVRGATKQYLRVANAAWEAPLQ